MEQLLDRKHTWRGRAREDSSRERIELHGFNLPYHRKLGEKIPHKTEDLIDIVSREDSFATTS